MNELENKIAFVTGSGQGIAWGIALKLAKAMVDIISADLNSDNAMMIKF